MPSVDAGMGKVDQPAGGFECSQASAKGMTVIKVIRLSNLYTDSFKS
jgi:hypothetical protein